MGDVDQWRQDQGMLESDWKRQQLFTECGDERCSRIKTSARQPKCMCFD